VTIRVVVADDQPLLRTGFKALIAAAPDLEVVGEAGDGREAVRLARAAQADVVLMDIRMPVLDGIAATRLISADDDLAGVRVLILTTFEIDEYVFAALRAGASGFLGKSAEADELLSAIRTVSRGDALLSPAATRSLIGRFLATPAAPPADDAARRGLAALTDREREITVMVAAGLSNDEIAARLVLSPATVKTHVNRAMAKVGARDRAQLVVFAHRCGLLLPAGEAGRGWLAPLSRPARAGVARYCPASGSACTVLTIARASSMWRPMLVIELKACRTVPARSIT
jgi:DNA-binding NarL/FixJ family response regulator